MEQMNISGACGYTFLFGSHICISIYTSGNGDGKTVIYMVLNWFDQNWSVAEKFWRQSQIFNTKMCDTVWLQSFQPPNFNEINCNSNLTPRYSSKQIYSAKL